ncbi:hypothetical protein [Mycobacteroides abscessus]|nr:hypothetical protein [Mycobacteroides abscessus]
MTAPPVPPGERWNPFEALAVDHSGVRCSFDRELPEQVWGLSGPGRIWVCKRLGGVARECSLAHELIHHERGVFGLRDPQERAAEEKLVDTLTAQRMIPWRSLVLTVFSDPHGDLARWASQLRVDRPTLNMRLLTLTEVERITLEGVRGCALPQLSLAGFGGGR